MENIGAVYFELKSSVIMKDLNSEPRTVYPAPQQ